LRELEGSHRQIKIFEADIFAEPVLNCWLLAEIGERLVWLSLAVAAGNSAYTFIGEVGQNPYCYWGIFRQKMCWHDLVVFSILRRL
jgi:hypothetical protein